MSESLPGDGSEAVLAAVKEDEETLVVKGHVKFFQRVLSVLPYGAKSLDVNRCSVCVCGCVYVCCSSHTHPSIFSVYNNYYSDMHDCTCMYPLSPYRMTVLFFAVCGLDILNSLDAIRPYEREQIIEWIYAQQILPHTTGETTSYCGFRGGSFLGMPFDSKKVTVSSETMPLPPSPSLSLPPFFVYCTCMYHHLCLTSFLSPSLSRYLHLALTTAAMLP